MYGVPTRTYVMIVYLRRIRVLVLHMIGYSYKYVCNDRRETTINLEYIILKSYYHHELRSSYFLILRISHFVAALVCWQNNVFIIDSQNWFVRCHNEPSY